MIGMLCITTDSYKPKDAGSTAYRGEMRSCWNRGMTVLVAVFLPLFVGWYSTTITLLKKAFQIATTIMYIRRSVSQNRHVHVSFWMYVNGVSTSTRNAGHRTGTPCTYPQPESCYHTRKHTRHGPSYLGNRQILSHLCFHVSLRPHRSPLEEKRPH